MGVPSYFRHIINRYRNIIVQKINGSVDNLYIDANCLFHPQCAIIVDQYIGQNVGQNVEKNAEQIERQKLIRLMIGQIISYIKLIIDHAMPQKLVYIAVDGVAPLAKMKQQRSRRYGHPANPINRINHRYNIPKNDVWNSVEITPGTKFMFFLHRKLLDFCSQYSDRVSVIYDSYLSPGEGEHKILQHIKHNDGHDDSISVIYGLDADLIFLSLGCGKKNIYLLREKNIIADKSDRSDQSDDLIYLSINNLDDAINNNINNMMKNSHVLSNDMTEDYIAICFFLGNDFIPNVPSIDIQINGLDILMNAYISVKEKLCENMIIRTDQKITINFDFFKKFLNILSQEEYEFLKTQLPAFQERNNRKKCFETDPRKIEIWNLENLRFPALDKRDIYRHDQRHWLDFPDWKTKYYDFHFGGSDPDFIDRISKNFVEGLFWTTHYYFDKCPSWKWQYYFAFPPLISDVSSFCSRHLNQSFYDSLFLPDQPVSIPTQLLSIIPPKHSHILPKKICHLMIEPTSPIIDLFPISYKISTQDHALLHKCPLVIPPIDILRIDHATKNIKFQTRFKQISPQYFPKK